MLTRFFNPYEFIEYFKDGTRKEDLFDGEIVAISSIADLLDVCEAYKKGSIKISHSELCEKFESFKAELVDSGFLSIVDLDHGKLSSSLFERDDGAVIDLWRKAAGSDISPKRSLRYLTLRITDDSSWWAEDVWQEMEDYHTEQDG